MTRRLLLALGLGLACCFTMFGQAAAPALGQAAAPAFAYSGDAGPGFWGEINSACAATPTSRQSPVDITGFVEDAKLRPLDVISGETSFTLKNPGYTVVGTPEAPAILTLQGTTYHLLQFHFHTLSEHTVEGRSGVMELHAVFQDSSSALAVIGVIYKLGRENAFLTQVLHNGLPRQTSSRSVTVASLNLAKAFTDLSSYYTYPGSLTTPPCSETVTWFVLQQFAEISAAQLESFRSILGNDFRPLQSLNHRVIQATPRKRNNDQ